MCTNNKNGRHVCISIYEDLVLANRERVYSEEGRPLMQIRRQRGEAPFGYFKMFGGLRRFAGRGLAYASKKTMMAAAGWNLLYQDARAVIYGRNQRGKCDRQYLACYRGDRLVSRRERAPQTGYKLLEPTQDVHDFLRSFYWVKYTFP